MAAESNILIYLMRHDLRVSDNPIFHRLASTDNHGFTHLVPVYVFPAQQIEISGFLKDGKLASPYPEAKSTVTKIWRTGPHRAKFIAECVWDLKQNLEALGSGLLIRVGNPSDVIADLLDGFSKEHEMVGAVWMTREGGSEERRDQRDISKLCKSKGAEFTLFTDEKYFVDE